MGGEEEAPRPAEGDAEKSKGRTGGLYMPPAKMKAMMKDMKDTSSKEYQKLSWEALKKSINGLVNKVNVSNIKNIVLEIFGENIIRGRALFVRSLLKAQMASPNFTHVYAALVSVINTKMPEIGELLLKRVLNQFRRAYKRNDKVVCNAVTRFIAHLVNQQVAHEIVALQLLTLLLEKPTDDSVEVAVGFVQQCGHTLSEVTPQGLNAIFGRLRGVLHEGEIDKRVQYMIEGLYAVRKAKFAEGACLLACRPAHNCSRALAVCRRHGAARCAGVDVNVEGTVATLKADSEAARRTSRAKAVLVRRRDELAAAAPFALEDYACEGSGDAEKCVLDCPRRNCTGAIGRCYEHAACVAVELKGGSEAFATLKRRRRPAP